MNGDRWNTNIVLHRSDRLFRAVLAPLFPKWVQPNHLTALRLLLIPAVLYYLAMERYEIGVPLFLVTALTDWFDGPLARTRGQITEWGIVYDPVVDKLLIGSVLFVVVLNHVNFELGVALLGVETLLIIVGWYRRLRGKIEPANVWGKIKMVSEVVGVTLLLVALWSKVNLFVNLSTGTLTMALIFAIISIFSRMF